MSLSLSMDVNMTSSLVTLHRFHFLYIINKKSNYIVTIINYSPTIFISALLYLNSYSVHDPPVKTPQASAN